MAKKVEETVKKTTKVQIEFCGGSAIVHRGEGPSIWDKTENSITWIKDKGYKPEDVEIIGDKPPCWDAIFSPPEPAVPVGGDPANVTAVQESIIESQIDPTKGQIS
jgi:hypothetical protein